MERHENHNSRVNKTTTDNELQVTTANDKEQQEFENSRFKKSCATCGKQFSSNFHLTRHEIIHIG